MRSSPPQRTRGLLCAALEATESPRGLPLLLPPALLSGEKKLASPPVDFARFVGAAPLSMMLLDAELLVEVRRCVMACAVELLDEERDDVGLGLMCGPSLATT